MIKTSYFNYKVTALLSTLTIVSSLTFTSNVNHTLPGFHITVKENNSNSIKLANTWDTINDKYEQLLETDKTKLINVEFDKWSEIANPLHNKNIQDDLISKNVLSQFKKQVKDKNNHFIPSGDKQYFDNTIVARSFASKNFDIQINSFGSVYLNYNDELPAHIVNGLFATISAKTSFANYFSVPYTLTASKDILSQSLADRLKIIPIGDNNIKVNNENELVVLAKKNKDEKLSIKCGSTEIKPIENGNLSYVVLSHNQEDAFADSTYKITATNVSESSYHDVTISNSTSPLAFHPGNNNDNNVDHQYLVQNNDANDNLLVMNYAKGNATVKFINNKDEWTCANVDSKTLMINDKTIKQINNGDILTASSSPTGIQVYYLALNTPSYKAQKQASGQYITIYNQKQVPTFNNCVNLFADPNNTTLQGFRQYLNTNTNVTITELKDNPSSLINQFITYQSAVAEHNYVNYLTTNSEEDNNPFHVDIKPTSKTLLNNWNVIILTIIFLSFLIILPFVILLLRKRKRLK